MTFARRWLCFLCATLLPVAAAQATGPVWRVTAPGGKVLYLAGSMHSLRSVDYPLPPQFNRAFEASTRLAFEVDPQELNRSSDSMVRGGKYGRRDSLKNHVDARTYEYLRRVFKIMGVPEEKFSGYRPWLLSFFVQTPGLHGFSDDLGIEEFLTKRARANGKPTTGLESAREHADVFAAMTDVQAEATLLITFIPQGDAVQSGTRMVNAWRRGDADLLWREVHEGYRDYPAIAERLLENRNRNWVPKIERFIASGKTYMVTVGAAHMGGPGGLLALLKARGYSIEQL
ncbi:MAG: TraB/GumN family protein [Verrucomicrobiota bacterium]|nr:TraB/GumN family protein [Verrucomicrobiota bacterium]